MSSDWESFWDEQARQDDINAMGGGKELGDRCSREHRWSL